MGACAPPSGTTPGIRRPVRTMTWPPISSRRMRFGEPTSPRVSGVIVAAFRTRPASRIAAAASWTTSFCVARRFSSERSNRRSSSSMPIVPARGPRSASSRGSCPVSSLEDDDRYVRHPAAFYGARSPRVPCTGMQWGRCSGEIAPRASAARFLRRFWLRCLTPFPTERKTVARKTVLVCDSCSKEVGEGKGATMRMTFTDARAARDRPISATIAPERCRAMLPRGAAAGRRPSPPGRASTAGKRAGKTRSALLAVAPRGRGPSIRPGLTSGAIYVFAALCRRSRCGDSGSSEARVRWPSL